MKTFAPKTQEPQHDHQRATNSPQATLDVSPRGVAQQQRLQAAFGPNVLQRQLFHMPIAPFTAVQAEEWNALVQRANGLGLANIDTIATLVDDSEVDIWASTTTVPLALAALRALMVTGLQALRREPQEANELGWADMLGFMQEFRAFGVLGGPVNTGGHAANTYTYTGHSTGQVQSVAIEVNAHGKTASNLNTRRGHLRALVGIYNSEVNAFIATL